MKNTLFWFKKCYQIYKVPSKEGGAGTCKLIHKWSCDECCQWESYLSQWLPLLSMVKATSAIQSNLQRFKSFLPSKCLPLLGRMSQASYGFCMSTWKLEYQFPVWIVGWIQYFCLAQSNIKTTGAKLGPIGRTVSANKIIWCWKFPWKKLLI